MLIQEAGITDEEQKKSFLRAAVSPKHATFLAYKQLPTYVAAVEAILQFKVELGRSTFAHGPQGSRVTHDPFAMEID